MNFLAHSYLSPDVPLIRLGNTFGDFVKGKKMDGIHSEVVKGVVLHRYIDSYTDGHILTKECKKIFINHFGLYSGIIVDMIFDYFLAKNWKKYSPETLEKYADKLFEDFDNQRNNLPEKIIEIVPVMQKNQWLFQYQSVDGLENILRQMSKRFQTKIDLCASIPLLVANEIALESMFYEFFTSIKSELKH